MFIRKFIVLGVLAIALVRPSTGVGQTATSLPSVPFEIKDVAGPRPFVYVEMNGKRFELMVHSNAGFYVQTTHERARSIGITELSDKTALGISSFGHVSSEGRGKASLDTLSVGPAVSHQVTLDVFEVPVPWMEGMLGIKWLVDKAVVIDYGSKRIGGSTAVFNVSTVSISVLDSQFVETAHIPSIASGERFGGPKGAVGRVAKSQSPLIFSLGGQQTNAVTPDIYDQYAYESVERPADASSRPVGSLGADFMLANRAVIDFGTNTLFVKP